MNALAEATRVAPETIAKGAPQSLLRFLTCGSVDDGKSTLIGRLLYECGAVFEDQLVSLEKDSKKFGTDGDNLDFALLVDGLSAEREQGITIDVAYRYFSSARRAFIVADTPGHEQYTRNMATGASTADLAILLVDARKGLLPQTRRHAFINSMLRVRHIVVAINKMDLVGFDRSVFDKIVADFKQVSSGLGFKTITFIPIAARGGDNVTKVSANTPWYSGKPLLTYLEEIDVSDPQAASGDTLFPVQWVNRPDHTFRGFSGTLAAGVLKPGDEITALPSGRTSRVARIVTADGDLNEAVAGHAPTIALTSEIDVSRGDVIVGPGQSIAKPSASIHARLIWTSAVPALAGSRFIIKLATSSVQAKIENLHYLLNIEDFKPLQAERIAMNAVALVTITLDKPIVVTDYAANKTLGGFILIDRFSNETVAIGMVDQSADVAALTAVPARAPADAVDPADRLRLWFEKYAGVAGSRARRRFEAEVAWRLLTALCLFGIASAVSGSFGLGAIIAVIDAIVRPFLFSLHRRYWNSRIRGSDNNDSGGGI
jgi:sulfate adenylyltransferase large subunit